MNTIAALVQAGQEAFIDKDSRQCYLHRRDYEALLDEHRERVRAGAVVDAAYVRITVCTPFGEWHVIPDPGLMQVQQGTARVPEISEMTQWICLKDGEFLQVEET